MKRISILIILISITWILKSQPEEYNREYFNTLVKRVSTQGTTPSIPRYNYYVDKLNEQFSSIQWKNDEVLSIKEISVIKPDDPDEWYYFVSIKTKRCSSPFYIYYNPAHKVLRHLFYFERNHLPIEITNHISAIQDKETKERTKEREAYEKKYELIRNAEKAKMDSIFYAKELLDALHRKNVEYSTKLVKERINQIDVNYTDNEGTSFLMLTSGLGLVELCRLLIEKGALIDSKNKYGETALMAACQYRQFEVAKTLIGKGANLDLQTLNGGTALMIASTQGKTEIVELLLKNGANTDFRSHEGLTAFDYAPNDEVRSIFETHSERKTTMVENSNSKDQIEIEDREDEIKRQNEIMIKTRDAIIQYYGQVRSIETKKEGADYGFVTLGATHDLAGRKLLLFPVPEYDYQEGGSVYVEISVDRSGNVIKAIPGIKGSTTLNWDLLKVSKEAALKAKFEPKEDAPVIQKAIVNYNFILN